MFPFKVTLLVFVSLLFTLTNLVHAQSSNEENFQDLSTWLNKRFDLKPGTNSIPSKDCRITIQNFPGSLSIQIQRGRHYSSFSAISKTDHPFYRFELKVNAGTGLSASMKETSCEEEGCTDTYYLTGLIFIDDKFLEIEDFRSNEKAPIICALN